MIRYNSNSKFKPYYSTTVVVIVDVNKLQQDFRSKNCLKAEKNNTDHGKTNTLITSLRI